METPVAPSKILERGPDYLRRQMELENETKVGMSAVERLAMSKPKYVKSQQVVGSTREPATAAGSVSVSSHGSSNRSSRGKLVSDLPLPGSGSVSPGQVRRSSSKKRPDSILLYRQKCDLLKASTGERKHHILRKLQSKSLQESEKERIPKPEGTTQECTVDSAQNGVSAKINKGNTSLLAVPEATEQIRRSGKGVGRSHSDISSRYSKNFADFDAFFKYCGLDGDVIETVGKDNFSAHSEEPERRVGSVSVADSDGGFSRSSGGSEGLQEEEVLEKIRQGTSVVERNARIIKWLYSCRNATETGKKLRDLE